MYVVGRIRLPKTSVARATFPVAPPRQPRYGLRLWTPMDLGDSLRTPMDSYGPRNPLWTPMALWTYSRTFSMDSYGTPAVLLLLSLTEVLLLLLSFFFKLSLLLLLAARARPVRRCRSARRPRRSPAQSSRFIKGGCSGNRA